MQTTGVGLLLTELAPRFATALRAALLAAGQPALESLVASARVQANCLCERARCCSFWAAADEVADRIASAEMLFVDVDGYGEVVIDYFEDQVVYIEVEGSAPELARQLEQADLPGRPAPF